ncbi:MAG: hypothetical protein KA841_04640, partial [Chitinophagales bacterium]|nr:hypothetical protein [Chitinophagales bacterium]
IILSSIMNANAVEIPHSAKPVLSQAADSLIQRKVVLVSDSISRSNTDSTFLNDSTTVFVTDTLSGNDTISQGEQGEIQDVITYNAEDSIVYDMTTKRMILYNNGDVNYQKIKLKANAIDFDWTSFTLTSEGTTDSTGALIGKPIFSDGEKEYRSRKMLYNFKTKKGKVYEVTTQEGDAFLHSAEIKKNEYDEWYGKSTMYTTCDLDHPHFYFKAKKVKVVPNKVLVTGPANLWVGDVPTPLVVPFAFFPVKQGKKSGIIVPQYGQDAVFGFFLRDGGYYWAMNDYVGLKFLGQVGTNGTFGVGTVAQYALRYKFTGNVSFSYLRTRPADPDLPGAKPANAYSFAWTHQQDPKSIPNSTFGANVQVQSRDFFQSSRVTDTRLLSTTFNSGVNFSHVFPKTPLSLTMSLRHSQNLLNKTISFTLPVIRLSVSRVTPFKSKVATGKPKWYENIGFNYFIELQSVLNTYDSLLFTASTKDRFSFGINQQLNIDAPIVLFKYLNINPAFSYQERTYFRGINTYWNPDTVYVPGGDGLIDTINGRVQTDTIWKFNSARNFNVSLTLNTKVYGFYTFKGKWLKGIKHVFTPSVSFNYHPDFGAAPFRYYRDVQYDAEGNTRKYSVFEPNPLYGIPGQGLEGSVFVSLANNFEAKVFSKKDTVTGTRKMGLLDQVNLSGGYNFAAKEFKVLPINLSVVSTKVFNLINLNFNAQFDPYAVDTLNRRINKFEWDENRKLLRFSSANIGASTTLHSKPKSTPNTDNAPKFTADYVSYNPNQVYDFDIPWSLSLGYNFNLSKGTTFNPDTIITMQTVRASLDFNITPKWKIAVSSGFDITRKQVTLTNVSVVRDLHCWELSFAWTPSLPSYRFQQFTILLHPKSNTLKDLKIQRRNQLGQEF